MVQTGSGGKTAQRCVLGVALSLTIYMALQLLTAWLLMRGGVGEGRLGTCVWVCALIAGFAFGPVAGVLVEFIKQLVKLLLKSTSTAFVGDLANFLIGCMLVLPASVIYQFHKSKKSALIGCAVGTVVMTVFGTWFNAVYLLPTFAKLFGMPMDAILGMGAAINAGVKDITSFVILMVAPINIIKGVGISAITMLVYKKMSPIIKYGNTPQESVRAVD